LKVLVTGANGLIGNLLYAHLLAQPERFDPYAMVRSLDPGKRSTLLESYQPLAPERARLADLTDFDSVQRAVEGMDVVVHLAADPDGRSGWDSVLQNNVTGTYHIYEASRLAGVKRVVFASTNQTVFGYRDVEPYKALMEGRYADVPPDYQPVTHLMPARPLNYYASSKVYGEALGHMYAYAHDLSVLCIRIGWVTPDNRVSDHPRMSGRVLWCSHRDIIQIHELCITAPLSLRYDLFFGQSDNRYNLVDIQHAREVLGYAPQDSAEDLLGA
jgi:NAD+ dependent glucose-6-phosphate dehydrogenase